MRTILWGASVLCVGLLCGCAEGPQYAAAPPPPPPPPVGYTQVPPLVALAERNGYKAGFDAGNRDIYYHAGYRPRDGQVYRYAPGYDYRLGPIPPYVDAFRAAYVRGYDEAFRRR